MARDSGSGFKSALIDTVNTLRAESDQQRAPSIAELTVQLEAETWKTAAWGVEASVCLHALKVQANTRVVERVGTSRFSHPAYWFDDEALSASSMANGWGLRFLTDQGEIIRPGHGQQVMFDFENGQIEVGGLVDVVGRKLYDEPHSAAELSAEIAWLQTYRNDLRRFVARQVVAHNADPNTLL